MESRRWEVGESETLSGALSGALSMTMKGHSGRAEEDRRKEKTKIDEVPAFAKALRRASSIKLPPSLGGFGEALATKLKKDRLSLLLSIFWTGGNSRRQQTHIPTWANADPIPPRIHASRLLLPPHVSVSPWLVLSCLSNERPDGLAELAPPCRGYRASR